MDSKPLSLPNKNLLNVAMAGANVVAMALFMGSSSFTLGTACLAATTVLSFAQACKSFTKSPLLRFQFFLKIDLCLVYDLHLRCGKENSTQNKRFLGKNSKKGKTEPYLPPLFSSPSCLL